MSQSVKGLEMSNVSFNGKLHPMSYVSATFWKFSQLLAAFAIFLHLLGNFHNCRQILPSFGNFWQIYHLFASIRNFSRLLANFGIVWLLSASFGNFFLTTLSNFWHVLAAFWQILPFLATVGNFKHLWAAFGIFLATFCCCHKLLAMFMNFLSIFSTVGTFVTFWQFLRMLAIFLAILGNLWKFLATFAFDVAISPSHQAFPSWHLFIFSSHLFVICQCDSL